MLRTLSQALIFQVAILLSLAPAKAADQDETRTAYREALANPESSEAIDRLLKLLPQVTHPITGHEPSYLFEGDIRVTASDVKRLLKQKASIIKETGASPQDVKPELIVNLDKDNNPTVWADLTGPRGRVLEYAVLRSSFPDQKSYLSVVNDMKAAAAAWENACPSCKVKFVHRPQHDNLQSADDFPALALSGDLRFLVTYHDAKGKFIAAAFFPDDPIEERLVLIDPSYFKPGLGYPKIGVLRHELGHTLGYRHEHIRKEAGCWSESGKWKPLTAYDSKSVMHYICSGGGNLKLELSKMDIAGHRAQYGLSASSAFADTSEAKQPSKLEPLK